MFLANYLIMDWNSSGRCAAANISAERQPSVMGEKKWREKIGMSRRRRSKRVSQIREISTLPGFALFPFKGM
jgi:hypothetical protein